MSEFLRTSELTESKAFIRSFVKEIVVVPGTATIRYTIPTPPDSPIGGRGRGRGRAAGGCSQYSQSWLPGEESNLHQGIQSPLCYRYTTRHPLGHPV